mgnify:CR=1 FL=1
MKILSLFFFALIHLSLSARSQTYTPDDFQQMDAPLPMTPEWFKLNGKVDHQIKVSLSNGNVQFSHFEWEKDTSNEYTLACGKLIAINQGEFGGGLYFEPLKPNSKVLINGKKSRVENDPWRGGLMVPETNPVLKRIANSVLLKNGIVNSIFSFKDSLYFLEGLSHLSSSYGILFRLGFEGTSFSISKVFDIGDAPSTYGIYRDTLLLVTRSGLYIIDEKMQKITILKDCFWQGLYPNSVAIRDMEHIYIGMRGGYALVNIRSKEVQFFRLLET